MSLHSIRSMSAPWTGRPRAAAPRASRIDWPTVRDRIDLEAVATALLGPPAKRVGSRLAWLCPFHDDHNPSFTVDAKGWRCWACGIGGHAAELVMRYRGCEFPEAARWLADLAGVAPSAAPARPIRPGPTDRPRPPIRPPVGPAGRPPEATASRSPVRAAKRPSDGPSGLAPADAVALVDAAAERLWTSEGTEALAYLRGRGLTETTIRGARLGWTPEVKLPTSDGARVWRASGIVIPWFEGGRLSLVKIRQPEGRRPKYAQAYADRPTLYPGTEAIRPGGTLIVVEGEFDAILLAQELGDLAIVVTLGSASSRPEGAAYLALLRCTRWFAAHDSDEAGDRAAGEWPARAVRVRPPTPHKDWTAGWTAGINLRLWWVERHFPDVFDREERAAIMEFDGGLSRNQAERAAGLTKRHALDRLPT